MADISLLREGDTSKPNPFTVCIIANRLLEAPAGSATYVVDPITANKPAFDVCSKYIVESLFGALPSQTEGVLKDPAIAPHVRIVSIVESSTPDPAAPDRDMQSFVAQDGASFLLIARRTQIRDYLLKVYGKTVDIAYAVSGSTTHNRASAWFATDDPPSGVPFILDGTSLVHCYNTLIPGTVAIHQSASSLTAPHEFGHALSSYQNGMVVDLYVDNNAAVNCKRGRPIVSPFRVYQAHTLLSDMTRSCIGYPTNWTSYHCERNGAPPGGPDLPAIMDNYYLACTGHTSEECENDAITRHFLRDRLLAKIGRP
jgi:hypothetical protein